MRAIHTDLDTLRQQVIDNAEIIVDSAICDFPVRYGTSNEYLKLDAYDLFFVHRTFKSCTPHIPPDCSEIVLGE
jgi:hypothetical protein